MMSTSGANPGERQTRTYQTFVDLVDTLVDDFDVIELLTVLSARCVELLGAAEAGILLADPSGELQVMAASTDRIGVLELFQVQNAEGPCMECFHSGQVVLEPNLGAGSRWPRFAAESLEAGYPSVCAIPLRLRALVLGCLNLFMSEPGGLSDAELALAQALADVAAIALIQNQVSRDAALRERQLQHALDSRVAIEQAKGMLAEFGQVDMDVAFRQLRTFARDHNRGLTEVAEALVSGQLTVRTIAGWRH